MESFIIFATLWRHIWKYDLALILWQMCFVIKKRTFYYFYIMRNLMWWYRYKLLLPCPLVSFVNPRLATGYLGIITKKIATNYALASWVIWACPYQQGGFLNFDKGSLFHFSRLQRSSTVVCSVCSGPAAQILPDIQIIVMLTCPEFLATISTKIHLFA